MSSQYFNTKDDACTVDCKTCIYYKDGCGGNDKGCEYYIYDE